MERLSVSMDNQVCGVCGSPHPIAEVPMLNAPGRKILVCDACFGPTPDVVAVIEESGILPLVAEA